MPVLDLLVDALATSRLTRLVVEDRITEGGRRWVVEQSGSELAGYLVGCPACISIYVGLGVAIIPRRVRWGLALSETTILIDRALRRSSATSGW
jgi:hypothetical protein